VITACGHRIDSLEVSMIRRLLTGVLPAAVAVVALLPAAADAAPAASAPRAAVPAVAAHEPPSLLPAPAHRTHHVSRRATHHRSNHPVGVVTTRHASLNVRSGPGTGYRTIGVRHPGRWLALQCRTHGSRVRGTHLWYRLAHGRGYVSARYVAVIRGSVPWC
jgi:hypothetical protein